MPGATMPEPASQPSLADRAVDLALRALLALAMRMPYERRVAFMGRAVARAAGPLAGYRARALANLALIHPDWTETRRRAVADQVLDNFGRTLIESYGWRDLRARLGPEDASGPGLGAVDEAQARGQGVILLTGHFGNHMTPIHALTQRGYTVGGMYRAMDNPLVNAHYAATFEDLSGPAFPKGKRGNLRFVRHVAGGGVAMLLFDLRERSGIPLPFLGRPALTATTGADLALRYGALLLTAWGVRRADGLGFDVLFDAPIPHSTGPAMMAEATARLERVVEAHPGQWFWVHRRWKGVSAGASPP
jgi:KDO2-lipid IV(A) lauroyltransferase